MPATVTFNAEERLAEIRAAAEAAVDKPAALGPDIDISRFTSVSEHDQIASLESLDRQIREAALMSGFTTDEKKERSASFFQLDRTPIYESVMDAYDGPDRDHGYRGCARAAIPRR